MHQEHHEEAVSDELPDPWPIADDFLGLSEPAARALAQTRGWSFRDKTPGGFFTDDLRPNRVDIWLGEHGTVTRAEVG